MMTGSSLNCIKISASSVKYEKLVVRGKLGSERLLYYDFIATYKLAFEYLLLVEKLLMELFDNRLVTYETTHSMSLIFENGRHSPAMIRYASQYEILAIF